MTRRALLACLVVAGGSAAAGAETVTVNCSRGQSLRAALARLDRAGPNTIRVRGACTESVEIRNHDMLTLKGEAGASIAMPEGLGASAPLDIANCRDLKISDLTLRAQAPCAGGACLALLMSNCQGCRVERSVLDGVTIVFGASYATFLKDTLRSNGSYAAFASYDDGFSRLINCAVEPGTGGGWWGVQVDTSSAVHIGGTTVRGFGNGIGVSNGARLLLGDLSQEPGSDPDQTVVIEDNWFRGIDVESKSTAAIDGVARIQNNGDQAGGGGGRVGVMVREGSFLRIGNGARIVSTSGNGLAAIVNSTITIVGYYPEFPPAVEISGSQARDVYCDASSIITGSSIVTGATKVTCPNLKPDPGGDALPYQ